jgi:hypothetical protein
LVWRFTVVRFDRDIANASTSGIELSAMNPSSHGERKP